MIRREQFEIIEGQVSGLKILTVLGRKINMKAPYRRSELINKLLSRTPLEHVVDLENELIEIQRLVDEMERQGLQCDAQSLYIILLKSISVLMGKISAPLHEVLRLPVTLYRFHSENKDKCDGYHFMVVLRAIADRVMYEEEFACLRTRRSKQFVMEEKVEKVDTTTKTVLRHLAPHGGQSHSQKYYKER